MKKIVCAALLQESNTFSPRPTGYGDFAVFRGNAMLEKIPVTRMFHDAGFLPVPTIYAYSVPGGTLDRDSFLQFQREILDRFPESEEIAGVWLYLHGALEVCDIGSGEAALVTEIRGRIGSRIPIAAALDFHANNTETLIRSVNIICGYKTAPHVDTEETQTQAGELLLKCIQKRILPKPVFVPIPMLLPGEMVTTPAEPAKTLMDQVRKTESTGRILAASFFCGMAWVDAPNSRASVVVCGEDTAESVTAAENLAELFWNRRAEFDFEEETAQPEEALSLAFANPAGPVFITDTGDNLTAGAPGDSIWYLRLILAEKYSGILVAGITEPDGVDRCRRAEPGTEISLTIGGKLTGSDQLAIEGTVKWTGLIPDNTGSRTLPAAVVRRGGTDIILTARRCSFTAPEIIETAGVSIPDYKVIVVKLGYLFDALRRISKRSILAFTPGSGCLDFRQFHYKRVPRPVFPKDNAAAWKPEAYYSPD
jgi:microcystin degradation protein MlrC